MLPALAYRTLRSANFRCVWKFAWNFGFKGMRSLQSHLPLISVGPLILVTWLGFGLVVAAGAIWQPTNAIPAKQAPLMRIMTPKPSEMTPLGKEKVIIFTREEVGPNTTWDFVAGAWELIPRQPEKPITKRIEFLHSSWEAGPAMGYQNRQHLADEYVRLQVDGDRPGNYNVNIYRIDYWSWKVDVIFQGPQAFGRGANAKAFFLDTDVAAMRVDRKTGKMAKPAMPFDFVTSIDCDEDFWLVRKQGAALDDLAVFDASSERFLGNVRMTAADVERIKYIKLSPTRRYLVYAKQPGEHEKGFPRSILTDVVVYDLKEGKAQKWPIEIFIYEGNGVAFFQAFDWWFADAQVLKIHTGFPTNPADASNLKTVETTLDLRRNLRREEAGIPLRPRPGRYADLIVPSYLKPRTDTVWPQQDLAFAFLEHKGLKGPWINDGNSRWDVAFSADGKRFALKGYKGEWKTCFLIGDFDKQTVERIASPKELEERVTMTMVWVKDSSGKGPKTVCKLAPDSVLPMNQSGLVLTE